MSRASHPDCRAILWEEAGICETDNISEWNYDETILELIREFSDGLILDCGAGRRPVYYSNVVNYEIVDYDSTDILGIGERLPFKDNSFDAVLSLAVLEHVRDPFQCANEIARVLRPNGKFFCQMPFLQPLHGYPHHYFNATHQGLRRLFEEKLEIQNISVPVGGFHPLFALNWILQSWANGLSETTKQQFLEMRIKELLAYPTVLLGEPFAKELPEETIFELACGFRLIAVKPE